MTDMKRKLLYTTIFVCVLISGCVGPVGHLNPLNPSSGEVSDITTDAHDEDELSEVNGTLDTVNESNISSEVTISNTGNGWEMEQVFEEDGERIGVLTYDGEEKAWEPEEGEAGEDNGNGDEVGEDEVMFEDTELQEDETVSVFVGESLLDEDYSLVVTQQGEEELVEETGLEEEIEIELDEEESTRSVNYTARIVNVSEDTEENAELSEETANSTKAEDTAKVEFVESSDEGELPSRFEDYDATVFLDMAETLRNLDRSEYSLRSVNGGNVTAGYPTYQIRLIEQGTVSQVNVDRKNWYPVQVGELRFEEVSFTK